MELSEFDYKQLSFIRNFQSLLDKPLLEEPVEIQEVKQVCDQLKWKIRGIVESMHKQDMFNDEVSLEALCSAVIDVPLKRFVEQKEKPWLKDKLTIALMGHLKTGKTSAMNCYFGENFPNGTEEATALSAYLYYGNNSSAESKLVDKEGGVQVITDEELQLFSVDTSCNFPFARMFDYIAKESNHKALLDKTFIDTPGLFSSSEVHSYSTYRVIDNCDVIFWFVDCRKSISETELSFIKENLSGKPVFYIFTFIDARGISKEKANVAIECIKEAINNAGLEAKGYLSFGRRPETQEIFKSELEQILNNLNDEYEVSNPIGQIVGLLSSLQSVIVDYQKAYTDQKNELEKQKEKLLNAAQQAAKTVNSSFASAARKSESMVNTFNNRCANAMLCGGAASALSSDINQLITSLGNIAQAWSNVDYDKIVEYGILCSTIHKIDNLLENSEITKNEINELLSTFIDE